MKTHTIYNSKESIHNLNIFLSRLLFCFFAEDTEIFEQDSIFTNTLAQHTTENGKDTHTFLDSLFDRLDTESGKGYPDFLAKFPYVNGGLFNQKINSPLFTAKARKTLIELGELQWAAINPDIFGSMIQAVVDKDYRSDLGMHYTSVENILKLVKPLFLDELYEAYENATTIAQLRALLKRISKIKFFDPACGSGNFLIITYKEIRLLEILILEKITDLEGNAPTIKWTDIQLSQFYGIEIDDFAHEMAILSLWLAEHQMNKVFEERLFDYGKSKPILPLKEAGQITQGNATRVDWNAVCPITTTDEVYVIGNPPYLGSSMQDKEQKKDMNFVFSMFNDFKNLDYISIWFYKGANYIKDYNAQIAFVSTNSICQGEQVALLWPKILNEKIEIGFAYQSFKWKNNAKGNAGVTVIILGLRNRSSKSKYLFNDNLRKDVKNINAYLIDSQDIYFTRNTFPINGFPELVRGSMPTDGGNFELTENEKTELISNYPEAKKYIKKYISGGDFIKGIYRYCLWIDDNDLQSASLIPFIKVRLEKVRQFRLQSIAPTTVDYAKYPNRFRQISYKETEAIIVPLTSSISRKYIPFGFVTEDYVVTNSAGVIYNAHPWHFGVIHSRMHMVWVDAVGGKLKTDYRYSTNLCYNNFPFPDITTKQKENLNLYVFAILDERARHPSKTMAQLYNPTTMPKGLLQAHQELDIAIEQCYRLQPFKNDTERLEYLFKMYEEMLQKDTLFAKQKQSRKKTVKK